MSRRPRLRLGAVRAAIASPRTVEGAALVACSTWVAVAVVLIVVPVSLSVPWLIFWVLGYAPAFVVLSWVAGLGASLGSRSARSERGRALAAAVGATLLVIAAAAVAAPIGLPAPWTRERDPLSVIWYAGMIAGVLLVVAGGHVVARRIRLGRRAAVAGAFVATAVAAGMLLLIVAVSMIGEPGWLDGPAPAVDGPPGSAAVLQTGAQLVLVVSMLAAFVTAFAPAHRAPATAVIGAVVVGAIGVGTLSWAALAPEPEHREVVAGGALVSPEPAPSAPPVVPSPYPVADLDAVRAGFAELSGLAVAAAGSDAVWRDVTPLAVREEPCEGGIRLRIEGEYALGTVTDSTSDEHDREVIDRNVAAADRIAEAWHQAGLGAAERLHDEPLLGGGSIVEVESAGVGFEFGVAQPFVTSRCLAAG